MTRKQIADMIKGIGLPCAYNQFEEAEAPDAPPFICFFYPNSNDLFADNVNYATIAVLVIELYSDNVDYEHEAAIETALTANELPYSRQQEYIDTERMYQTTYTLEVCIDNGQ